MCRIALWFQSQNLHFFYNEIGACPIESTGMAESAPKALRPQAQMPNIVTIPERLNLVSTGV
jgi:hypothetical protein